MDGESPVVVPGEKAERGRKLTLTIVRVLVSISAAVIVTFVVFEGIDRLAQQIVRFALTCGLGWLLYRRVTWARWMVGALCLVSGWVAVSMIANDPEAMMPNLLLLLMGITYGASGAVLLLSPEVRAYFG